MFRGVPTGGFQGAGTEIMISGCCPACIAAGQQIGHHLGCVYDEAVVALVQGGLARQVRRDGEWQVELTAAGVRAFAKTTNKRRGGAGRAAKAR